MAFECYTQRERSRIEYRSSKDYRIYQYEYGGGAVTFGRGNIFYSEFASQRLCQLVGGDVKPITPDGNRFRFADGVWDDSTKTICCVREDHEKPAPKDVVNEVVSVQTTDGSMKIMATGNE